jgi:hypothetical protein
MKGEIFAMGETRYTRSRARDVKKRQKDEVVLPISWPLPDEVFRSDLNSLPLDVFDSVGADFWMSQAAVN